MTQQEPKRDPWKLVEAAHYIYGETPERSMVTKTLFDAALKGERQVAHGATGDAALDPLGSQPAHCAKIARATPEAHIL